MVGDFQYLPQFLEAGVLLGKASQEAVPILTEEDAGHHVELLPAVGLLPAIHENIGDTGHDPQKSANSADDQDQSQYFTGLSPGTECPRTPRWPG